MQHNIQDIDALVKTIRMINNSLLDAVIRHGHEEYFVGKDTFILYLLFEKNDVD
jgi:hypothetical protein